jgi:hypothetical protein
MGPFVANKNQVGYFGLDRLQHVPRPVRTAIIHHHDFMRHVMLEKFPMQTPDRGSDATLLIPRGDDNGKQLQFLK